MNTKELKKPHKEVGWEKQSVPTGTKLNDGGNVSLSHPATKTKRKVNKMNNEVLELLEKSEGVLHGHFCLTSGLHSNIYFQCAKLYQYPQIVEKIGEKLAEALKDVEYDTIVAPAIGALIIGYETAKQAGKRNLFVERKDGEMQLRRGYKLEKGEKIVIIEDVITTARTIKETIESVKEFGVEVAAVGCIVDRTCGKTGFNIKSLLQIDPVTFDPEDCALCKEGVPLVKPGSRAK